MWRVIAIPVIAAIEAALLLSLSDLLGPGFAFFFGVYGVLLLNTVFITLTSRRIQFASSLLAVVVIFFTYCKSIAYLVGRDVKEAVAEIQIQTSGGQISVEAIHTVINTKKWLAPRMGDAVIEENNNYIFFYYIMKRSITHWYSSRDGIGHSDD